MKKEHILEIHNLSINYHSQGKEVCAVRDLNLNLEHGETLGLVGETGAGKTTTALGIMGILPDVTARVKGGTIIYKGEDLLKKSKVQMRAARGKEVSMIFQDPMTSLDPVMTVGKQIEEMIALHWDGRRDEITKQAEHMLEVVGIRKERYHDYPHQFSGGMKQRVMIAIALSCSPNLLIADEPTTALDVTIQAQVLELMKNLKDQYQMSMIMITHDLGIVAEICDKVAIMYAGNVVEYGSVEDVYNHTAHPYTEALFHSLPRIDEDQEELQVISGLPPDPTLLPSGCVFHPRCPYAEAACEKEMPEAYEVRAGHVSRCIRCRKEVE